MKHFETFGRRMILLTPRRGNRVCLCRSVHPLCYRSAHHSTSPKHTLSSPEFPSRTHHSTTPSDLPIYTFLSYPSTQFTSFLGPSSFVAVFLAGEDVGDEVEVALRPAVAAKDAADASSDPDAAAGGEDGPGI
jgi:hypothetical protein